MLRRVSGLMLIFLAACSGYDPAPAASASPAPAPAPSVSAPPADRLAVKKAASALLGVMLDLEHVVDDSNVMDNNERYGRYFSRPIEEPLNRWQTMRDASGSDDVGDLGYCRDAARALASLGEMVHVKGFAPQFVDERRAQYREALPKCQRALDQFK